jgi:EmrB/QacA subfamily drug resistance transporter
MQRRGWILVAVVLASGIVFLDSSVVYVALKSIGQDLPTTFVGVLEGESYVVNGYLLTLSALLILAGALADAYGRRRMFMVGLAGFGAASTLCGLAPTMELLIAFRLVQGVFGAFLVPTSLAIINANFSGIERGRAFGIWAAATSVTAIAGPVIGGLAVDQVSWRLAFLINPPLVVLALAIAWRYLPESRDTEGSRRFDWLGAAAIAVAVGGLTYGAIRGQQSHWTDTSAFVALPIGALAAIALLPLMTRRAHPLVPPFLFRSRNFTVTNVSTILIYGTIYTFGQFQAIYLQGTLGYSALASGLTTIPTSLFLIFLSTKMGTLAGRWGPRLFMTVGPALMAVGVLWMARVPADSPAWRASVSQPVSLIPPAQTWFDLLPSLLVYGLGIAIMVAPLTTALMTSVPARHSGLASAINNAVSRIGPLLAGAVIFIGITASFYNGLGSRLGIATDTPAVRERFPALYLPEKGSPSEVAAARTASTDSYHLAMLIAAALCLGGAAANGLGIVNPPREDGEAQAASQG